MKKREFLAMIKKGKFSPFYLFLGEEYEQEQALGTLKETLFSKEQDIIDFNFNLLYGDEAEASSIIDFANTFPLKVKRRLVIVKRISGLPKVQREKLASYLNQGISTSTCLVMCDQKIERQDPLYKASFKAGGVVNFWPPFDEEIPSFVMARARGSGKGMDIEAAKSLVEIKGKNLGELSNEIDKLILYVGERMSINSEDVLAVSGGSGTRIIFDLLEAIAEGNSPKGLSRLYQLILQGIPPLMILSMIIREVRRIYQARFLLEEGKTPQEVTTYLGITSKREIPRLMKGVKSFKGMDAEGSLKHLLEADMALKSQEKKYNPWTLELLVMRLCGIPGEAH